MQNDHYEPFVRPNRRIDVRIQHPCTTSKEIPIDCVDEFGKYNNCDQL